MGAQYICVVLIVCLVNNGFATPFLYDGSTTGHQELHGVTTGARKHSLQKRDLVSIPKTLINELVANLQQTAASASQSVANFSAVLAQESELFNQKLVQETDKLRASAEETVNNATSQLFAVTTDIVQCFEDNLKNTYDLLNNTISDVTGCFTQSIEQYTNQFDELTKLGTEAYVLGGEAVQKSQECSTKGNIFEVSGCLAGVLVEMQAKSASITGQISILISSIGLGLNSLPVSLTICEVASIGNASLSIASIVFEIAQCNANALF